MSKQEATETTLHFIPFSSCANPSFWHKLTEQKLDVFKLDQTAADIWGYYSNLNCTNKPILEVDSTSFNSEYNGLKFYLPYHGLILNKNTVEQFKECNKQHEIQIVGKVLEDHLKSGRAISDPSLLNYFLILSFADLKKYNYYYWFAFLSLQSIKPHLLKRCPITEVLDENQQTALCSQYMNLNNRDKPFFLVSYKDPIDVLTLSTKILTEDTSANVENYEDYLFAFSDPASYSFPGLSLHNYMLLLLFYCPILHGKTIKFLGLRINNKGSVIKCNNSIIWEVLMPKIDKATIFEDAESLWVGYERNERDKMGPRLAAMKSSLSPVSLAESTVYLNLKLMKWRLLPDIDLDKIKNTKCLLLGAGTLGCAVARNLMAWGVRTITFVDSGNISYSNPVRQNLFTFHDSLGNREKASTAAERLSDIFPGVKSAGYKLTVPMPGHPVGESLLKQTKESYQDLKKLITDHDIVFLLMDSRESRWLPTLLCTSLKKITINAALGFDTYLVMRHGYKNGTTSIEDICTPSTVKCIPGNELGCYFCNDITAPGDSLKDRTLDQQCTVTRPGISNIAGALAVELAISLTQHKKGGSAPAFFKINSKQNDDVSYDDECSLGIVPHSIRGFLSMFNHVLPATERYNQCIACSEVVVKQYEEKGFEFLLEIFNNSSHLEEITGLSKIYTCPGEILELDTSEDDSP